MDMSDSAGMRSKLLSFMSCTPRRQQANSITGNREQAGDVGMSDIASKKPRIGSKLSDQLLAESARRQRELIRKKIEALDQLPLPVVPPSEDDVVPPENVIPLSENAVLPPEDVVPHSEDTVPPPEDVVAPSKDVAPPSKDVIPRPNSVIHLSDPTFNTILPFPFVDGWLPDRFKIDNEDDERKWFYMGREKFTELLDKHDEIWKSPQSFEVMIYGTRGYGKSHLLAALVCYLAARDKKVVYIPDCRIFMNGPVEQMKSAMLFAWADDESKQQEIMALDDEGDIFTFFKAQKDVIFVIDQINALEKEIDDNEYMANEKGRLKKWLNFLRRNRKAFISSSANNHSVHQGAARQSLSQIMYVYGGLTRVSLRSNNSFVKWGRF